MTEPAATIVVPVLRQPDDWLERAVRSALAQTLPTAVVVVVADATPASNRRLLDDVARDAPGLRVMPERRANFAAALNTGFEAATTARIGMLLADDWLEPTAVARTLPADGDIVCTGATFYAADGETVVAIKDRRNSELARRQSPEARADYLCHFLLFRRDPLIAAGGVDETVGLTGADDYDLPWTMIERGASVTIVEERLVNRRDHAGERLTLRDPREQRPDLERVLDKHGVRGEERREILERHSVWFGRPVHVVQAELARRQPPRGSAG